VTSAAKRRLRQQLDAAKQGDPGALAQLLSSLEQNGPRFAFSIPEMLQPERPAFRLGITGPPGAGKSTLVARLLGRLRQQNWRIGVIAVDPSSPFSGGAILGDRIRYNEHALDPQIFIRSLGSRGSLGGLSASTHLMARAFDACGFDVLLIETVGVGQTELDILHVADQVTVVLVPESGDSIQAMKAGLMEIADVFLVNKADRPGAEALVREIQIAVQEGESSHRPEVFAVVATEGTGMDPWVQFVKQAVASNVAKQNRLNPARLREEAKALLRSEVEQKIVAKTRNVKRPGDLARLWK
jgi:LAO/AO transport system kinase